MPAGRSTSDGTADAVCGAPPTASDAWIDDGVDVFAYFNNDFGGAAVADAEWFRARLTS